MKGTGGNFCGTSGDGSAVKVTVPVNPPPGAINETTSVHIAVINVILTIPSMAGEMFTGLQNLLREKHLHLLGRETQPGSALHENVIDASLPDPIIEDGKDFESEEFNPKPVHDTGRAMDRAIKKLIKFREIDNCGVND